MCTSNDSCICKCLVLFLSLIAGLIAGLIIALLPALLGTLGFAIIFGITAVLAIITVALSIYVSNGNASSALTRCFCEFAGFLIFNVLLALIFSSVLLSLTFLPGIALAILGGFTVFFFAAALLTFICFLICLIRRTCNRGC